MVNRKIFKEPIMFLVMGIPGSGKSWFARSLSRQVSAAHVDTERIRYELFEDASYSDDEDVVVENVTNYFINSLIGPRCSIIIDGGVNNYSRRKELQKIADDAGYVVVLVWVQTNEELSRIRSKSEVDKSVDTYKRKLSTNQFNNQVESLEKPANKEDPVVVSGSHSGRSQLKSIVTRVNDLKLLSISTTNKKSKNTSKAPMVGAGKSQVGVSEKRRNTMR